MYKKGFRYSLTDNGHLRYIIIHKIGEYFSTDKGSFLSKNPSNIPICTKLIKLHLQNVNIISLIQNPNDGFL